MKKILFIVLLSLATVSRLAAQCNTVNCSGTTASGTNASAIGTNTTASGHSSFASGNLAVAQGNFSTALGTGVTANADGSVSIGQFVLSAGSYSLAIGRGINNNLRLSNGIPNSLLIGFMSEKPTFFVSETPNGFQSGKVGIGNVTSPQAKLHIRGDAQEDATLRLEATGSGKHARMYFTGEHHITAGNDDDFRFRTTEGKNFVFQNGDIYIEDITHGIIMKSPNGQCWRGTLNDQGMLVFTMVACPDEGTTGSTVNNSPAHDIRIYPNPASKVVIIETNRFYPDADVIITGVDGRQHLRQSLTGNTTRVNIENLAPGTYLIVVDKNKLRLSSQRLIVQ